MLCACSELFCLFVPSAREASKAGLTNAIIVVRVFTWFSSCCSFTRPFCSPLSCVYASPSIPSCLKPFSTLQFTPGIGYGSYAIPPWSAISNQLRTSSASFEHWSVAFTVKSRLSWDCCWIWLWSFIMTGDVIQFLTWSSLCCVCCCLSLFVGFVSHSSSRWITCVSAAIRGLEVWDVFFAASAGVFSSRYSICAFFSLAMRFCASLSSLGSRSILIFLERSRYFTRPSDVSFLASVGKYHVIRWRVWCKDDPFR